MTASGPGGSAGWLMTAACAARMVSVLSSSSVARLSGTPRYPRSRRATAATPSGVCTSPAPPLMQMTPRNRPAAAGTPVSVAQAPPPADCPAMVTRAGSPPKAAIFSWTHSSARTKSRTPRLAGASRTSRKPAAPSR